MSKSRSKELKRHGKKGANRGELEDGPSNFPLASTPGDDFPDEGVDTEGRARKRKNSGEEMKLQDPLVAFGSEIMVMILNQLDARSVARSRLISRRWHSIASSDEIWSRKCGELWLGKAHIPRISKVPGISKLASYSLSIMDSKRARITWNDLCDHVWEFHFTEAAPEYWRNLDPYWTGTGSPLRRYFHPDGSISADPGDLVWGGHESCYTTVTGLLEDGKIREHYVRINRWPQFYVSRKPDWGWELANHICCYTSVPDAEKEDGTGPQFSSFLI